MIGKTSMKAAIVVATVILLGTLYLPHGRGVHSDQEYSAVLYHHCIFDLSDAGDIQAYNKK